jgi:hypothetical protein
MGFNRFWIIAHGTLSQWSSDFQLIIHGTLTGFSTFLLSIFYAFFGISTISIFFMIFQLKPHRDILYIWEIIQNPREQSAKFQWYRRRNLPSGKTAMFKSGKNANDHVPCHFE